MRPGAWGWIATFGVVVIADTLLIAKKKATMSTIFGDALEHPIRRWPVTFAWTFLTAHLFSVFLPRWARKFDPIGDSARFLGRRLGRWI